MNVSIVEAGNHGSPAEIDGPCRRVPVSQIVGPYGQNPPVLDGDGFANRKGIVDRDDFAVVEHEVGGRTLCPEACDAPGRQDAGGIQEVTSGESHGSSLISLCLEVQAQRHLAHAVATVFRGLHGLRHSERAG